MNESASSSPADASKPVTAKSGAWKKTYAPGETVGQVRAKLNEYASIDGAAVAYSGTTALPDDHVLQAGETIEFIKKTGEKG